MKSMYADSAEILISNPKMFIVSHNDGDMITYGGSHSYAQIPSFRELLVKVRKGVQSSWAYTRPVTRVRTDDDDFRIEWRSYWVFEAEEDILLFTLLASSQPRPITMYPQNLHFTVTLVT